MERPDDAEEHRLQLNGFARVAGVDEAGRGPLAGPVVAAAVILPPGLELSGLNDSKKLSPAARERLYLLITECSEADWAVAEVSAEEIDRINILQATHLAMRRALLGLQRLSDHALVDGRPVPSLPVPHTAVVKGDGKCRCIAAASVLAKTARDRLMKAAHDRYPQYDFASHKGYGTARHLHLLSLHGPSPIHRLTFAPVAKAARQA